MVDENILRKYMPEPPINDPVVRWDDGTPDGYLEGGGTTSKFPTVEEAVYPSDVNEEQTKRIYPSPTYCTAEYVYETLGMWDQRLQRKRLPSDMDVQDVNYINQLILSTEDRIDRETNQSWREKQVKDKILQVKTYQNDQLNYRFTKWAMGGNFCTLQKPVRPWDPEKGDRLYMRGLRATWRDITENVQRDYDDIDNTKIWFDRDLGRMYVNSLWERGSQYRITYRYGNIEDGVPYDIQRACGLLTGISLIQSDWYVTKLGQGGDLGSNVDRRVQNMREEANRILALNQKATTARILYG